MSGTVQKIKISDADGKKIAAVVHYPETPTNRLAVLCPGYLDAKDYDHLKKLSEVLAARGYTVVRFDPIGTWESEGDITDYTTSRYLKNIKSVIEYMLADGTYKHILLGGHSRGGMVSILYAARDPRISTVLGIMPSSPRTFTGKRSEEWEKNGFALSQRDIPGATEKREFRVPYSHAIDRNQYDVLEDVKKIHAPIIFLTGDMDTIVLPENVKEIFNNANDPKKIIVLEGVGHDYRHNAEEIEKVNAAIVECLDHMV